MRLEGGDMKGELRVERVPYSLLEAIRDRITLSELVGRSLKLKRQGREMVGLCPFHQERTPSFSVNDKKGVWCCFGCGERGDVIDFAQRVYRMNFRQAVEVLASEHGLSTATPFIDPAVSKRNEERRRQQKEERQRYHAAAVRIWNEALSIENSPAERYLRSRAITGPLPASLRYHPELRYRVSDKTWIVLPAMVGQVVRFDVDPLATIAVHRTYLKREGVGKAGVDKPKSMLGDSRGGGVWLGSGPGSVSDLDSLAVTEGIETGLSLQVLKGTPTIAATSTGGMVALQLPALPAGKRVTIGADNDPNDAGLRAALNVAQRWRDEGREVSVESPRSVKDWNDVLRALESQSPSPRPRLGP